MSGDGKSSLIRLLISLSEEKLESSKSSSYPSPVLGGKYLDHFPVTGDTHLYVDPSTASDSLPLLYVDTEGLDGGDFQPQRLKRQNQQDESHKARRARAIFSTRPREIHYSTSNTEAQSRQWTVQQLYPRLLYTFSDVIIFVMKNPK